MVTRYFRHKERVTRDGRAGVVKDIEGVYVNVIWDADQTRDWVHVEDLKPRAD